MKSDVERSEEYKLLSRGKWSLLDLYFVDQGVISSTKPLDLNFKIPTFNSKID